MIKTYFNTLRIGVCIFIIIMTGACGEKSFTFGDRMKQEGQTTVDLGKKWSEGNKMVQKGEKMVKEGNKEIKEGTQKVKSGEEFIKKGKTIMNHVENQYQLLKKNPPESILPEN